MCGIVGLRTWDETAADADTVRAMADRLRHRGPDGASYYCSGGIALGHRRLAIIDVEGGVQPLANEDETVWVTFNGEIYYFRALRYQLLATGHRFRTRSDTEVLVHA